MTMFFLVARSGRAGPFLPTPGGDRGALVPPHPRTAPVSAKETPEAVGNLANCTISDRQNGFILQDSNAGDMA